VEGKEQRRMIHDPAVPRGWGGRGAGRGGSRVGEGGHQSHAEIFGSKIARSAGAECDEYTNDHLIITIIILILIILTILIIIIIIIITNWQT